jgi:hypothetical protein
MNLGYCYLRGKGLPADKEEALRLFRLAVEQGEPKAADELERLESSAAYERPPRGFKDLVGQGMTLIGGTRSTHPPSVVPENVQVRFFDATDPGRQLGLVGVAGVQPQPVGDQTEDDRVGCERTAEVRMQSESVPLSELVPGFEKTLVPSSSLKALKAGFDKIRERMNGKRFLVTTFRRSIDIDAFPDDSVSIGEAFSREEDAAAEAARIHDEICNKYLAEVSGLDSWKWEVVDHCLPAASWTDVASDEPTSDLKVAKSCITKLKRGWPDIEYVAVMAFELPADTDPVAALLGEFYFRPYRVELLRSLEDEGRLSDG